MTMRHILPIALLAVPALYAQSYTLGVGVYPGDPHENFAPLTQPDQTYRNLALHRPAYQSSSYDYNLTAQLITDGIKDTRLPRWLSVSTSQQGVLPKNEREWLLDRNWVTGVNLPGHHAWVQVELGGGDVEPEIDRIDLDVAMGQKLGLREWKGAVSGSDDGQTWKELAAPQARTAGAPVSLHPYRSPRRPVVAFIASIWMAIRSSTGK